MSNSSFFNADWYSAPGNSILDLIELKKISWDTLSQELNLPSPELSNLLKGYAALTPDIAKNLSNVLGGSPDFWIERENLFRKNLSKVEFVSRESLLKSFDRVFLNKNHTTNERINLNEQFLAFFDVPDFPTWNIKYEHLFQTTYFKKSKTQQAKKVAIATWLRSAEVKSTSLETKKWDKHKLVNSLEEIKKLTKVKDPKRFLPILKRIFADCGVKFIVLKTPSGCPVNGAIRFIEEDQPLIILSFRYRTDDHFWFTVFHEIGHLVLHSFRELYLETENVDFLLNDIESEANEFAEKILLSGLDKNELSKVPTEHKAIVRKATQLGISPGILVGQMQYKKVVRFDHFNKLKKRYTWEEIYSIQ